MQTHDEGEPWRDYAPPSPRPTADPMLAKMQYGYARLRHIATALVRRWEEIESGQNERDDVVTQLMDKIAAILQEERYP